MGAKTLGAAPCPRHSPGQRSSGLLPTTFALSRQVLALPGAPTGLCAAGAPATVLMARGTAVGEGRAAAGRRERGRQPAPVPAGGRGARGQRRRSQPAPAPTYWRAMSGPVDQRDTGCCSTFPARRKAPPPRLRAVPLNTDLPILWLPTAGSHRNPATKKVSRRRERLERKFSLAPHYLSPSPGLGKAAGNQGSRRADSRVHLLHPWPRQRAQGGCPHAGASCPSSVSDPASRDHAGRPTHHGDSRRDRASAWSGCREAELERSLLGELQKLVPFAKKQALDTQALTGANGNPGGTPSRRDRRRLGKGETEAT